jgi:hypothetical protein
MTTSEYLQFLPEGPFDSEERRTIAAVHDAVSGVEGKEAILSTVRRNIDQLNQLGIILQRYPPLSRSQSLGRRQRGLSSLVDRLSQSNLSNFEMSLPTRALIGRSLVMAEMNFYRLLRFVCSDAPEEIRAELLDRVECHLCHSIYTRLAGEVLTSIASDGQAAREERKKAVHVLLHIWGHVTFSLGNVLPLLQATWEARRRVVVAGGTLLGVSEMFQLLQAGCDPRFVEFLVRPAHTENEAAAFREFLLGATTEQLEHLEQNLERTGRTSVSLDELTSLSQDAENLDRRADPALQMFEFFLSRHLQAGSRRQADLPGPKRTAEEYVLRHYLETVPLEELIGD